MIKILRIIFFIPVMYLGALLAIIVTAIWNIPLTFLEWFVNLFGDWHLWGIFGKSSVSFFEIIYVFSSGLFMATIGLFLALAVFPYPKYRNRVIYVLGIILFLGFVSPTQIAIYGGSITLFIAKIIGLILGFLIVFPFTKKTNKQNPINFIDRKLEVGKIKEKSNKQKIQELLNKADELRNLEIYNEAVRFYLEALELSKKERGVEYIGSDDWHSKVWFMACNGMGIAYAKWGKLYDAIENFEDAIAFASNKEALKVAQDNLDKYKKVVKDKTNINIL